MKLSDCIKTSFRALRTNKLRTFLTMLGIVIGIMSVILIMSIGSGAEGFILNQVGGFGTTNISIEPGALNPKGPPDIALGINLTSLKSEDIEAVSELGLIKYTSGLVLGKDIAGYKNNNSEVTFSGVNAPYREIMDLDVALGRFFNSEAVESRMQVAILGSQVKKDLFEDENPLGRKIKIKNNKFEIIGVLKETGGLGFGFNHDEQVIIPLPVVQKELLGIDYLIAILVQAKNEDVVSEAEDTIRWKLRDEHNIDNPEDDLSQDDFHTGTQEQAQEIVSQITGVLSIMLSSIAAISLVVGGIGIMNIMLVSVTERTHEIGLRKAVGATNGNILIQFLLESIILTVLGGLGGIILGASFSLLASTIIKNLGFEDWVFSVPLMSILLAVGVAGFVGLVFGIYPARRAAKLDPIEALRYE